jgi:predicted GNAT family acetyltransferase
VEIAVADAEAAAAAAAAIEIATELGVKRFEDAEAFLAATGDFLTAREAEHNLLLGLAGTLVARPHIYPQPPYLAAVARGQDVVGVALRTPPHGVVLSEVEEKAAVDLLAADAARLYAELPSVFGPKVASRRFAEIWGHSSGQTAGRGMAQRVFRAERVRPPAGVPGALRRAGEMDRRLLVDWIGAFQRDVGQASRGRPAEEAVDDYLTRGESGGIYLWEDGEPVSVAGCGSPTPNGLRVGPVYTPPERRGRGYASALTAELTATLLAGGRRFCFLFTDLANPISNRIYERIGYEPVTDVDEYRFT